jgi:hypothetical protein
VTSERPKRPVASVGISLRDWRPGAQSHRRPPVAVGLCIIASFALVGLSIAASAGVVHVASAVLLGNGPAPGQGGADYLVLQNNIVVQRRAAVVAYVASLAEYKQSSVRESGAVGINLDASETARREGELTSRVLECIDAVDGYNLAAQARAAADLHAAGLPESFAWAVDCAAQPAEVSR